jgi:hypothetical protein
MNTLIGMAVGVLAMLVIMGFIAAVGTMVFSNVNNLVSLYTGIAAGVILVIAIVAYLA